MIRRASILALLLAASAAAYEPPPPSAHFYRYLAAATPAAGDVRDGLVSEWTFDQTLADTVNGWTLVPANPLDAANTIYVASQNGYAVNMVTNSTRFTTTNLPALTTSASLVLLLKLASASPTSVNSGLVDVDSIVATTHYLFSGLGYFGVFRNARVDGVVPAAGIVRTNWHMIVITTSPSEGYKVYQNTTLLTNVAAQTNVSILAPIVIGAAGETSTTIFNGQADDARIYNRAISSAEIETLGRYYGVIQ
jgi:hypothetical protein